jgi:hypothetical protein
MVKAGLSDSTLALIDLSLFLAAGLLGTFAIACV